MAASGLSENDILKGLVRRGALTDLGKDLNAQFLSTPRGASPEKLDREQH